jgi:hypothetical protein
MTYELGLRGERLRHKQGGNCADSTSSISISSSALWRVREDTNVMFAVVHSQRAATVGERYSNIDARTCAASADDHDLIAHAATQRLEIGNPHADKEYRLIWKLACVVTSVRSRAS